MEEQDQDCCHNIAELKQKYKKLMKQFNLPEFKKFNEDFDISKIDPETDTLLRDIRKTMLTKFASILQFVELLLNPTTGSMFNMILVKGINSEESEILKQLFETLGEIEIDSFALDVNYQEQAEAKFINEKFTTWQEIKPKLDKVVSSLKSNWKKQTSKKQRYYFG